MRIGVPQEVKVQEYRVGLIPAAVREYVRHGHDVLVQSGAGQGSGASDEDYKRAGAVIVQDPQEIFSLADMIVKVKEPQPKEWAQLRPDQILFTYLHLAADPEQLSGLIASGCTAIAYETVVAADGSLPLLAPMSEVAGRLSVEAAAHALRKPAGGPGLLLGGVPGVRAARVAIIGGGVVGLQAARMAIGLGADVTVIDRSLQRLRTLDELFNGRVRTTYSTAEAIEREVAAADVVIGAVLVVGENAPKLIDRALLRQMKRRAVLVDVAIDQGGCAETSRPTTHENPTYVEEEIIHYCVANMPGAVPQTSSAALNHATLPFGLKIADRGLKGLLSEPALLSGINIHSGRVTHEGLARSSNRNYVPPQEALAKGLHLCGA